MIPVLTSTVFTAAYAITVAIAFSPRSTLEHITAQQWQSLNGSVHGRLLQSAPFSRPCFPLANVTTGVADAAECQAIQQNYFDSAFRVAKAGNYEGNQWEGCPATGDQCLLDDTNPFDTAAFAPPRVCSQASVPSYFIDVREPSDAAAGFKFAEQNDIPLVIKNTGHDYNGRSARPNSLALWTNNLKNISFVPNFVPDGCDSTMAPRPAAVLGAGVDFTHLYAFGEANNLTLPGGACPTVSPSGGYVLGGGHSALTNTVGLAADRALQFRVVLPTGKYVTANACQNQDLYFALRGGGGGTFGVVLELTTVALPRTPVQIIQILDFPKTDANIRAFLTIVIDQSLGWAKQGWGGYIQPFEFQFIHPSFTPEQAISTMKPLTDWAVTVNATIIQQEVVSYVTWWNDFLRPVDNPSGFPTTHASRLIPADNFQTEQARQTLLNATLAATAGHASAFMFATTPFVFKADQQTSVTPAWRNSLWHVVISDIWNFNTTVTEKRSIIDKLSADADILRNITPHSGAYINEADVNEPNFTASFWGKNYQRLVQLKKKYDPSHILDCWHCVSFKGTSDPAYKCYVSP